MEQTFTEREYAVGLTREEYVRSQELVTLALRGRQQRWSRIFSFVMMALCVLALAVEYRLSGEIDPALAVVMTLMAVAEVWMMLALPRQIRRRHEAAYDTTVFSGHSFDGNLTVESHGITKRTADDTTQVRFEDCVAVVEAAEMLIFCVNGGKSIVVPARCLTMEDAEHIKQAAFAQVSRTRQFLLQPIVPQLEQRVPLVHTLGVVPEEPLMTVKVEYTPKEMKSQMVEAALRQFAGKVPQKVLLAVFFTILLYFWMDIMPLPMFLLSMLALLLWDVLFAWFRAGRIVAVSNGDACFFRLNLGEKALHIQGRGQAARRMTVPWSYVTRVGEWPTEVVFFAERARLFSVPKRCIENMEQLRQIVDAHIAE